MWGPSATHPSSLTLKASTHLPRRRKTWRRSWGGKWIQVRAPHHTKEESQEIGRGMGKLLHSCPPPSPTKISLVAHPTQVWRKEDSGKCGVICWYYKVTTPLKKVSFVLEIWMWKEELSYGCSLYKMEEKEHILWRIMFLKQAEYTYKHIIDFI